RLFVRGGGRCVIVDMNAGSGEQVVQSLPAGSAIVVHTDVSDESQVANVRARALDAFGRIDILVNAAGISSYFGPALVEDTTLSDWNRMISINLTGTFLMSKHVLVDMKRQRYGRIVNIASTAVLGAGYRGQAPYAASKAGVVGLMRALAREGGPFGITCNGVGPGPTKTPTRSLLVEKEQDFIETVPVGFLGEADDIANPVVFLCSQEARFVTGQLVYVDGGVSIPWNIDHIIPPPQTPSAREHP
ncbi:SDR family oxidoreductase, partial [Mesorhizobium sp. M7A.F.Ca.US.006.01.1.1]|uniref:SDR family NAD(P)-dependent oxidoreductase n=1 Tax=Mesorhizobium sp. M7A.F.Ca.US.006.01.1.1 TaxID=2496707 RepID=UPI000FD5F888